MIPGRIKLKPMQAEIGVLEKAVRLNNVFIDKLVLSSTVDDESLEVLGISVVKKEDE